MRLKSSITVCTKCGGGSQIEDTLKQDTKYVKRTRACKDCGATWQTAEIALADVKRLQRLDQWFKKLEKMR